MTSKRMIAGVLAAVLLAGCSQSPISPSVRRSVLPHAAAEASPDAPPPPPATTGGIGGMGSGT